jgi:hypothetical protein
LAFSRFGYRCLGCSEQEDLGLESNCVNGGRIRNRILFVEAICHEPAMSARKVQTSFLLLLLSAMHAFGQMSVTVTPVKTTRQKAIVPLAIKNNFTEKVESARAAVFLLDDQGKMVGQASRWVIGGSGDKTGLAPGATNSFHFVVAANKPFTTTNLTAKVEFSRVVLVGGKLADTREVNVKPAEK